MQGPAVDWLTSKRIPAIGKLNFFQRLAAASMPKGSTAGLKAQAPSGQYSAINVAVPTGTTSYALSPMSAIQSRTYTGSMTISGSFSDIYGQKGTWSGNLNDTLIVSVDRAGNGSGYEIFSGYLSLTVTNPDGSQKSSGGSISFLTADFSLQKGKFSHTESSGLDFGGLMTTLNLNGSFGSTQASIVEKLALPFTGFVNGVLVSGSVNGSGTVRASKILTIDGTAARQSAFFAKDTKPFQNVAITDLNSSMVTMTATVKLSNPANGKLTNLAGGTYNRATGTYTITGKEEIVNRALRGLEFDPAGAPGTPNRPLATTFTISVMDTNGTSRTDHATSVIATNPLRVTGTRTSQAASGTKSVSPFSTVTITDLSGSRSETVKVTLSNAGNGRLTNLGGGIYNKTTGVYLIHATPTAATAALRGLVFQPSASSRSVTTGFTISVVNADGASTFNASTSVVDHPAPAKAANASSLGLFSQYIAPGFHDVPLHAASATFATHDLIPIPHSELAARV